MTRVFDLIPISWVGIVAFMAEIFTKKPKTSYIGLVLYDDQEKHIGNSREEGFADLKTGKGV